MKATTYITILGLLTTSAAQALPTGAYSFTGDFYEDFDSMGSTGTQPPLAADGQQPWEIQVGTFGNELQPRASLETATGENPAGEVRAYNGGGRNSNDRALGSFALSIGDQRDLTCALRNDTGADITELYIYFDTEVWSKTVDDRWGGYTMKYSLDGINWTAPGAPFTPSTHINGNPTTQDNWLVEPVLVLDAGGQLLLPEAIPAGATFYLKFDGRGGVTPPHLGGHKKDIGVFIDNLEVNSPTNPDRERPTNPDAGFIEWLAENTTPETMTEILADPESTGEMIFLYATGNKYGGNLHPHSNGVAPGAKFDITPGRRDVTYRVQASEDIYNSTWNDVLTIDSQGNIITGTNIYYEIVEIDPATQKVVLNTDAFENLPGQNLYFRLLVKLNQI